MRELLSIIHPQNKHKIMIFYKLRKNNNEKSDQFGKIYGRAVSTQMTDTETIAERIQRNCSVKRSDVKAVLTELSEVVSDELKSSHSVRIDGLGIFKVGLVTKPADKEEDFKVQTNVTDMRINFLPELKRQPDGKSLKSLLRDAKVQKLSDFSSKKDDEGDGTDPQPEP